MERGDPSEGSRHQRGRKNRRCPKSVTLLSLFYNSNNKLQPKYASESSPGLGTSRGLVAFSASAGSAALQVDAKFKQTSFPYFLAEPITDFLLQSSNRQNMDSS